MNEVMTKEVLLSLLEGWRSMEVPGEILLDATIDYGIDVERPIQEYANMFSFANWNSKHSIKVHLIGGSVYKNYRCGSKGERRICDVYRVVKAICGYFLVDITPSENLYEYRG